MSFFKKTGEKILDKSKKGGDFILDKSKKGGGFILDKGKKGGGFILEKSVTGVAAVGNFVDKVGPVPLMKKPIEYEEEEEKCSEP